MYAVIETGGQQLRVSQGDKVVINKIEGNEGDKVKFDQVLMVGGKKLTVGEPLVKGASVEAKIDMQFRGEKVCVFKYKRRKNYKRTKGHRQPFTKVEIGKISG